MHVYEIRYNRKRHTNQGPDFAKDKYFPSLTSIFAWDIIGENIPVPSEYVICYLSQAFYNHFLSE